MNTSSNATVMSNRDFYRQREYAALHRIPGVYELIHSNVDQRSALEKKYTLSGDRRILPEKEPRDPDGNDGTA